MKQAENERQMYKAAAEKTARKIVQPRAADIDVTGEFPGDIAEAFGRQGLLSILLPEEYGGTGGNITALCTVVEEIAKVSAAASLIILGQAMGTLPISLKGTPSQQERFFSEIGKNNLLMGFAFSELEQALEPGAIRATARREAKGYVLNGRKGWVTHGGVAAFYSVFAATGPGQGGKGVTAFVLQGSAPGLHLGQRAEPLGMKGASICDVILENCRVPAENRLGEEGEGWSVATRTLAMARPAMGAQAVGIAQGALDYAMQYGNERMQFGKVITSFQAVRFMIADMATRVEAARALVYNAAALADARAENAEKLSMMAKSYASDIAMKVTTDAVQLLGGYGYMRDYPVERMMRDAKVTQVYQGPNQVQRGVLARQLLNP